MELDSEISESKSVSAPKWSVDVTEMNENIFSFTVILLWYFLRLSRSLMQRIWVYN